MVRGLECLFGRVLAKDIISRVNIPPFPRSAMDGFAVIAKDTFGSSPNGPALLKFKPEGSRISQGECSRIHTGRTLPQGADGMIMREDASVSSDGRFVEVRTATSPGLHIAPLGEDMKKGERILKAGTSLTASRIGILAALGKTSAFVYKKPVVGIIATGDEIVPPGSKRKSGQVFDTNSHMISAGVRLLGCIPKSYGIVRDGEDYILKALRTALHECNIVITNAGSSVGEPDHTISAVKRAGGKLLFHGVAIRPGKPVALAICAGKKPVLCLPGFPASTLIAFNLLGVPLINALRGVPKLADGFGTFSGKLARPIASNLGIADIVRVSIDKKNKKVLPLFVRGGGMITSISRADGWIIVPKNVEGLRTGETVTVERIPTEIGA